MAISPRSGAFACLLGVTCKLNHGIGGRPNPFVPNDRGNHPQHECESGCFVNHEENRSGVASASAGPATADRLISLLAGNARALAAAALVAKLATLSVASVLARGLGERDFGRYVVAIAFASILGVFVELGTSR